MDIAVVKQMIEHSDIVPARVALAECPLDLYRTQLEEFVQERWGYVEQGAFAEHYDAPGKYGEHRPH